MRSHFHTTRTSSLRAHLALGGGSSLLSRQALHADRSGDVARGHLQYGAACHSTAKALASAKHPSCHTASWYRWETLYIDNDIIDVTRADQTRAPKICGSQQRRQVLAMPVVKPPAEELENASAGVGPVRIDD